MRGKRIIWTWIIAVLLTSLAIAGIGTPSSSIILAVEPPMNTGSVGDTFKVDINVYDVTDLYGWNVYLTFSADVINVASIKRGPFLEGAGPTNWQLFEATNPPGTPYGAINNTVGYLVVGDSLLPPLPSSGASGNGKLLEITFEIMDLGVSLIHFEESKLTTVISGTKVSLPHEAIDGLFDNREEFPPPTAGMIAPSLGVQGMPMTFTSTSSDPDGWLISEEWDFGDGETATGTVVDHTFAAAGVYTVTLTVTDNDLQTATATIDILIQIWMEGGWIPDLVGFCAKPEHPDLNEAIDGRLLDLIGRVGNPTEDEYEVYVEFELYSKDEIKKLGYLCTDIYTMSAGEIVDLAATFDTANTTWNAWSGSAEWVFYGYVHWMMHKYIGFASCYSRPVGTEEWTKGYVIDYLSFHVKEARHDIGIVDMWTDPTKVSPGELVEVYVNVTNEGSMSETFTVPITYDGETIDEIDVTLEAGESQLLETTWDTTGVDLGVYVLESKLPALCFERDTTDQGDYCVVYIVAP